MIEGQPRVCPVPDAMLAGDRINPLWIVLVVAIAITTLLGYEWREKEQDLEAVRSELKVTTARSSELEQHATRLSLDREEAVRQRLYIQDKLDGAHNATRVLQSKLDQSNSAIEALRSQAVTTQLEIDDKRSRLGLLQSEIEGLKQLLDKANDAAEHDERKRKFGQAH